jgi:hypothetical protein
MKLKLGDRLRLSWMTRKLDFASLGDKRDAA